MATSFKPSSATFSLKTYQNSIIHALQIYYSVLHNCHSSSVSATEKKIFEMTRKRFTHRNHLCDNLGRPFTVFNQTVGKLVTDAKFCVTAIVSSRFSTRCHHPPGTKTVSPKDQKLTTSYSTIQFLDTYSCTKVNL